MWQRRRAIETCGAVLLVMAAPTTAAAELVQHETIVHDTTTRVEIELDASTVLCSAADYGALFLKILIPELAALTLLDHQNSGAGAPCVAAGACAPGNMPEDILDPTCSTAAVDIRVRAVRLDELDTVQETCTVTLREDVHVDIRGVPFTHERFASLGSRPYADCLATPPTPPTPPTPTTPSAPARQTSYDGTNDGRGGDREPAAAGCAVDGDGHAGLAGLVLAAAAVMSRRRRTVV